MIPGLPPLVHLERVTKVAGDNATSVTLPASGTIAGHANFPAGAQHVVVMYSARSTASADEAHATVRVNGDSGANYDMQRIDGETGDVSPNAYKEQGTSNWSQIASIAGANVASEVYTPGWIMIPNAFATTGYTAMLNMVGNHSHRARFGAGTWRNTAAITSMTFGISGSYLVGDFDLYVVDESYLVTSGKDVVAGSAAAFTNRNVPAQNGDITIINYLRSSYAHTNDGTDIVLNSDTTAGNYHGQFLYGYNTTAQGTSTGGHQIGGCNGNNADSSYFSGHLTTINAFNPGDDDPHVLSINGHVSVSSADAFVALSSNRRDNPAAVTSVNIQPSNGSTWEIGSGQWVYAVPKALIGAQQTPDDAAVTFDLSALTIPANTAHLRVNVYGRSSVAAVSDAFDLSINGDTTAANYDHQFLYSEGSNNTAATSSGDRYAGSTTGNSHTAEIFNGGTIIFFDYASTTRHKHMLFMYGEDVGQQMGLNSALWQNTAAISTINLKPRNGNWVDGTIIELEAVVGPGWTGTVMGVSNPTKVLGVDTKNIKKVMGVS